MLYNFKEITIGSIFPLKNCEYKLLISNNISNAHYSCMIFAYNATKIIENWCSRSEKVENRMAYKCLS